MNPVPPSDPLPCRRVAVVVDPWCRYSNVAPFHPVERYPEYPFAETASAGFPPGGCDAYGVVRESLRLLGYDAGRYGSPQWNPLASLVAPRTTVVIKPNFVFHRNESGNGIEAVVSHPSVLRPIIDYCYLAMGGRGRVVIADAPQMDCDFDALRSGIGLDKLVSFYAGQPGFSVSVLDLRQLRCTRDDAGEFYPSTGFTRHDDADPNGFALCNLGVQSELDGMEGLENLYGADYDRRFTAEHHRKGVHQYSVSRSVLKADTVICVPKMKTHRKVGVTLGMKLLVGINGDKNYLAHFRVGDPSCHGDEFPPHSARSVGWRRQVWRFLHDHVLRRRTPLSDRLWRFLMSHAIPSARVFTRLGLVARRTESDRIVAGNWYGNDTAWRMAVDLAKIFTYGDPEGVLRATPQRRYLVIVDGIVAGEGDGPTGPSAVPAGAIVAGENILAVDTAATTLMGFDYRKIPLLAKAWATRELPLSPFPLHGYTVVSADPGMNDVSVDACRKFIFSPPTHWKGHVELEPV